ncbi:MAG: M23 family metallopeptidase [Clostridia bacterium]|nr:M23 family metallopeptidase [Clostridia bacterium]
MTKKTHIIYSIISICAVLAYGGFIVKNAMREVDTVEETVPYEKEEIAEIEEIELITEPADAVSHTHIDVPEKADEEPSSEAPTTEALTSFSPLFPTVGTVTKYFSLNHTYNSATSDWRAHCGIDIEALPAEAVVSVEDGTVTACYTDPLWGNVIEISHGEYTSVYRNLSTLIMVKEGDSVSRGEKISGVGSTAVTESGNAHLHFELMHYSEYIDPLELLG